MSLLTLTYPIFPVFSRTPISFSSLLFQNLIFISLSSFLSSVSGPSILSVLLSLPSISFLSFSSFLTLLSYDFPLSFHFFSPYLFIYASLHFLPHHHHSLPFFNFPLFLRSKIIFLQFLSFHISHWFPFHLLFRNLPQLPFSSPFQSC